MRTEAEYERVTIALRVDALYQYDDISPEEPHHYQWRGMTGSGDTKESAIEALALKLGGKRD